MSRIQQDQFVDDDEEGVCPLCVEEFDLADRNFRPCPCGYQICQFCFNNIRATMNGLCPACRRPYDESTIEFKNMTLEEMAKHKRQIAQKAKNNARLRVVQKNAGLRVVQKNLVYVTGLTTTILEDRLLETLRGSEYFGQYGKIIKIVVRKTKENAHHQQSVGVYVTFARKEDAAACIVAVDGSQNGDRTLRAQYGTTKYCSAYVRGEQCNNRNCVFLHEPGEGSDSFTRQDLSMMNIIQTQQPAQSATPHPAPPPHRGPPTAGAQQRALRAENVWAANRQLAAEQRAQDRCFKEVAEGVAAFESIYEKIQQTNNLSQKEKQKDSLKKEIRKLQRLRDQIKTWAVMSDIKDKKPLLDRRKLIETQMEKFKAVEKEMKTTAYSKEGLQLASKLDPKDKKKMEMMEFLQHMNEELEWQVETFEAEMESLRAGIKKGEKDNSKAERISELEWTTERHIWHRIKLELLQRALENGNVWAEQVRELEDCIRYYVENNQDPDFMEDDTIYDGFNLQEGEAIFGMGQNVDRVSSQDTQSIQDDAADVEGRTGAKGKISDSTLSGARRPSTQMKFPLPALATLHTPLPGVSNATSSRMKPASLPNRTPGEPLKYASYASVAAAAAASDKNGIGIAPLPPPPGAVAVQHGLGPTGARTSATASPVSSHPQPASRPQVASAELAQQVQTSKFPAAIASIPVTPAVEKESLSRVPSSDDAEAAARAKKDAGGPEAFDTPSPAGEHIEHNVFFAESSRDDSSNTFRSSSVLGAESTAPTSVSGEGLSAKYFHKTQIAQFYIIEEEEPEEESGHTVPPFDGQSTISADSIVVLTAQQRNDVVEKFSKALLRDLPRKCFASDNENVEMSTFHQSFSGSVKAYSKKVMANAERRSRRRQASKAIRFLRNEIFHKCYETLGGLTHSEQRNIPSIVHKLGQHDIHEKTIAEKVSEWSAHLLDFPDGVLSDPTSSMLLPGVNENDTNIPLVVGLHPNDKPAGDVCNLSDTTEQSFSHISQLSQDEDDNISAEDQDVYTYLTEHSAFSELVDELKALVERHFCNQKELIHHRILLAIRRPSIIEQFPDGIFRASFYIDWDALNFLQTCYSLSQDLRHVIAITGTPVNAQLATVETYLQQTWPDHTWKLIDALNTAIAATIHGVEDVEPDQISPQQIHISLEKKEISVSGTEDLLVAVGQQLAWLGAACRVSAGQLAHCYTSFTDVKSTGPKLPELKFEIKYEVTSLDSGGLTSCWNGLVGDSVVVAGFPFAQRDSSAIGLEVPLQIMATIADIPLATFYRGGYVLKGRSMAFVPVKRGIDFVQWHLCKQSAGHISYQDIKSMFPDRLLVKELDESGLLGIRSFLGWCPESSNDLASGAYDYRAISYTKTPYLSKKVLSLTGANIGFQQFAAGGLNFAISNRSRMYRTEKAQYYEDLLDAAKQIPVVLQDMENRRAWYADGERVILHVILHRHALKPFKANGSVQLASASPDNPASVRQAMMDNADNLVSLDRDIGRSGIRSKSFKDLVNELYTVLEGLMAEIVDIADAGIELKLDWKKHIQGWEYMDLVNRKLTPRLRETELKSTCGQWPELARDRNAIVLFGNHLQNIISPHQSLQLCRHFKELPKHKDYLAIESEKLENMYVESGAADDRTQITLTGLQLHCSQHLFEGCPYATFRTNHCKCERIQQLVPKRAKGKVKPIPRMNMTGAVIIGQGNTSWINELSHTWVALRGTFQHQSVYSHSRGPDPPQSAKGASVADFYLPQPSSPSSVSGSKYSSDTRSLSITTASTKATTMVCDTSSARSSRFGQVSVSNSTKSPAKTLRETSSMPLREPGCLPNTSSASTVSLGSKASPLGKHDRSSQLQPNGFGYSGSITRQLEQTPQYNRMAQRPKYSRDNTPVVAQTNTLSHLHPQPVLKTLAENDRMDMPSMSTPPLRRKPNFPSSNLSMFRHPHEFVRSGRGSMRDV